jgi:hypothetical protein
VEADDDASQHLQDSSLRMGGIGKGRPKKGLRTAGLSSFQQQNRQKDDSVRFHVASSDLRLKVSKIRDKG